MKKEIKHCLNCNSIVKGKFCSECGQSINVTRINYLHFIEELQFNLLHINKGMVYTVKALLTKPGKSIKEYLSGKRVQYIKPFTFLLIWGSIYSLIVHFFNVYPDFEVNKPINEVDNTTLNYTSFYNFYYGHYSLILLAIIPFFALASYIVYRKNGYNYMEHLVTYSYIHGAKVIIILLFYPLYYYSHSIYIYYTTIITLSLYNIWVLIQLFRTTSYFKDIFKALLSFILAFFLTFLITVAAIEIINIL